MRNCCVNKVKDKSLYKSCLVYPIDVTGEYIE